MLAGGIVDRFCSQDGADFQYGTVNVDLQFTAGTSGAVPTTLTVAEGILSVVKSTNDYIVTFQDSYVRLLNGYGFIIQSTPDPTAASWGVKISAVSIADGSPTVTLSPYDEAGTAEPLATGDVLFFTFRLQYSTANSGQ